MSRPYARFIKGMDVVCLLLSGKFDSKGVSVVPRLPLNNESCTFAKYEISSADGRSLRDNYSDLKTKLTPGIGHGVTGIPT
jgi:hypothetical protein